MDRRRDDRRRFRQEMKEAALWLCQGRRMPLPPLLKRRQVLAWARAAGAEVFVETGTYLGDTVAAARHRFRRVYSIEISPRYHLRALERFQGCAEVEILPGDSSDVLPELLSRPEFAGVRAAFWLDGHYSGGNTGRGDCVTPILAELGPVLRRRRDCVMVDDARLFTGTDGYPSLETLRTFVARARPDLTMQVEKDIIRLLDAAQTSSRRAANAGRGTAESTAFESG